MRRAGGRRAAVAAMILLGLAAVSAAQPADQDWTVSQFDDGSYFSATLAPMGGPGMALVCGERSPRGLSGLATGNMEPDITPAGAFRVYISDRTIGPPRQEAEQRDDVMIVVGGQTGFRLRGLRWNELFSTWQIDLPAGDPSLAAIAAAPGFELRHRGGRAALSSQGFGAGLSRLAGYCQSMFAAIGKPWPGAATAGGGAMPAPRPAMRQMAVAETARGCRGPATLRPGAITPAQIDGDGVEDVILNWAAVRCPGSALSPFCGMSQCLVSIYVSALYPLRGKPVSVYAPSMRLQPLTNGNDGVALSARLPVCRNLYGTDSCEQIWYWTGADFVPLR
ncbi:hypothetical protein [Pseudodonghicola flavimaris]|uniref:Uncharacterized protein n=1 Tax=Pseudodonghicola flavimaris TaxID=3050036 RepID=A0ABT7F3I0_9RHOB|nr:hypothetical protein [Pseudodonghicola flavimaris]MDK3019161.1 hypothetical protein [Pseudodonghicola flavimaris]